MLLMLIRHSVVMPRRGLIICLSIHLPFYSWKYQSEQTITIRSKLFVVHICYFLVEYLENKITYCYATDLRGRWTWGPPSQKIVFFCLNLEWRTPNPLREKSWKNIIVRLFPMSTYKFLHPDIGRFFVLNPRVQTQYCPSLGAETCTLT